MQYIFQPQIPCSLFEPPGTITTAEQIHLQHTITSLGQKSGLPGSHAAGLVHFLGEGVYVQHAPLYWMHLCFMENTEAKAIINRKKERYQSFWT
jgi:hypothetical protein